LERHSVAVRQGDYKLQSLLHFFNPPGTPFTLNCPPMQLSYGDEADGQKFASQIGEVESGTGVTRPKE
jgi:hypothetical protein